MRLPRRPQYVTVRLDADMAPEGPLLGGKWPGLKRALTYHYFGPRRLRYGARVCVNDGQFKNTFGTVINPRSLYRGYTYGVRRVKRKTIALPTTVDVEVEVA